MNVCVVCTQQLQALTALQPVQLFMGTLTASSPHDSSSPVQQQMRWNGSAGIAQPLQNLSQQQQQPVLLHMLDPQQEEAMLAPYHMLLGSELVQLLQVYFCLCFVAYKVLAWSILACSRFPLTCCTWLAFHGQMSANLGKSHAQFLPCHDASTGVFALRPRCRVPNLPASKNQSNLCNPPCPSPSPLAPTHRN